MPNLIQPPTTTEPIGTFKNIDYVRHHGQFVGKTMEGDFAVPYEITTPLNPAQGDPTYVFEPPHFTGGTVARRVYLGSNFLFDRGYRHASVGFSNVFRRILNPHAHPVFTLRIKGKPIDVIEPFQPGEVKDLNILRQFAFVLKQTPPWILRPVERIYAIGFSDSGETVHEIYKPFGHFLFDLTFACTAPYIAPVHHLTGQKPIIVFNTESDFNSLAVPNPKFPLYRWYAVAGGPHIPDAWLTRPGFPVGQGRIPPVANTSPINWLHFVRAIFIAGDQWVRKGTQPPAGVMLRVNPKGAIARDGLCNALGGIRHPALENGEATFSASIVRRNLEFMPWELFGGYGNPKELADNEFPQYLKSFKAATNALVAARYLLPEGADRLIREAQLQPPNTYTRNYMNGLLFPVPTS